MQTTVIPTSYPGSFFGKKKERSWEKEKKERSILVPRPKLGRPSQWPWVRLLINLVPRACDPWEGNEGSGIIRFREESDWPLKWMRSSILARIPGFRQQIIPEPSFPSQGSQARGTRLAVDLRRNSDVKSLIYQLLPSMFDYINSRKK